MSCVCQAFLKSIASHARMHLQKCCGMPVETLDHHPHLLRYIALKGDGGQTGIVTDSRGRYVLMHSSALHL